MLREWRCLRCRSTLRIPEIAEVAQSHATFLANTIHRARRSRADAFLRKADSQNFSRNKNNLTSHKQRSQQETRTRHRATTLWRRAVDHPRLVEKLVFSFRLFLSVRARG